MNITRLAGDTVITESMDELQTLLLDTANNEFIQEGLEILIDKIKL